MHAYARVGVFPFCVTFVDRSLITIRPPRFMQTCISVDSGEEVERKVKILTVFVNIIIYSLLAMICTLITYIFHVSRSKKMSKF